MALTLLSLNVRGLNDLSKRRKTYHALRRTRADILLLQETHSSHSSQRFWRSMWGAKMLSSHGSPASCGVSILFRRHLKVEILDVFRDLRGRLLIAKCKIGSETFVIANVYAPNNDDPDFFVEVAEQIMDMGEPTCIVAGDFNMTFQDIDRRNSTERHVHAVRAWSQAAQSLGLRDAWREHHPKQPGFTWHRGDKSSRLDYVFSSLDLLTGSSMKKRPGLWSDHDALLFSFQLSSITRGPGLWKFNASLLLYNDFQSSLQCALEQALVDAPANPHLRWEFLKMTIREFCRKFGRDKKVERETEIADLKFRILDLDVLSEKFGLSLADQHLLASSRAKLADLVAAKSDGARIRCRTNWFQNGERSSKYFFALEKIRGMEGSVRELWDEDNGEFSQNPTRIATIAEYSKRSLSTHFFIFRFRSVLISIREK